MYHTGQTCYLEDYMANAIKLLGSNSITLAEFLITQVFTEKNQENFTDRISDFFSKQFNPFRN